ncbi:COG1361 S-layer family protein [Halobium salinum]|uniref:COG1361 S-layer family protein n=1 Tax=Halobium salinum TaxID=1364940 RepID=A0ABD5PB34_9EURY|nr:NEW3 domain-containing protein [Halobium salinum]
MSQTVSPYAVLLVALLLTAGSVPLSTPAVADDRVAVNGEPNLFAYLPYNVLVPGEETTVVVEVLNSGDIDDVSTNASAEISSNTRRQFEERVTTAKQVRVALLERDDVPVDVRTGTVPLGDIPDGEVRRAEFTVSVPEDARPGTYELPFRYVMTYDEEIAANGTVLDDSFVLRTVPLVVEVEPQARFGVVAAGADVQPGGTGTVTLDVTNRGSEVARDATLRVRADGGDLSLVGGDGDAGGNGAGGDGVDGRFLGTLRPGDRAAVTYRVALADDARPGSYPLEAVVVYTDEDGDRVESAPIGVGVVPGTEQRFTLSDVFATLRAGEEGEIRGTLTNNGPTDAVDAVVRLSVGSESLVPQETEFALGTLGADEFREFAFPVDTRDGADPGPRQVTFVVVYRDADADRRTSEELDAVAFVGDRRDAFIVTPVNATVEAGGEAEVVLAVTNNDDEAVRNVNAKLFASDPLSVTDDSAFVDSLEPGETATVAFTVSAAGDAVAKQYPVTVDFLYDTPDGETKLSETFQVGVTVVEPERRGFLPSPTLLGGLGLGLLLLLVLLLFLRRRRRGRGKEGDGGDDEPTGFPGSDPDVA